MKGDLQPELGATWTWVGGCNFNRAGRAFTSPLQGQLMAPSDTQDAKFLKTVLQGSQK